MEYQPSKETLTIFELLLSSIEKDKKKLQDEPKYQIFYV